MNTLWVVNGQLITPRGIVSGAMEVAGGRIAAIRRAAPPGARTINVRGAYVAPGFVDLHVWGDPAVVARECVRSGTTAFLATLGPEGPAQLARDIQAHTHDAESLGARCLGLHLEGPFLNPIRGGVLPRRWMRAPTVRELERLWRASRGRVRLLTLAPERPGAMAAIRWCRRHRIVVSLGHSDADAACAGRAVAAGAVAVTHVFNGMRPFHHRAPGLLDVALTEPRLTAMVIADGIHVSPTALRLLVAAKGAGRVALVTDSVRLQQAAWSFVQRAGAYYDRHGTLAGSRLTMIQAVRNAVALGGASLTDAVRMASEVPARLLGLRDRGTIGLGQRADLVAFDRQFRVRVTMIGGRVVYQRGL